MSRKKTSDFIDVSALAKMYLSKWYLFAISIFVCLAMGFLFTRIYKVKYGVRANIVIQQEENSPLSAMGDLGALIGSSGLVDDEIFVISSHSLYRDVVRDLGLNSKHFVKTGFLRKELTYPDFPIDVTTSAGVADTLREPLAFSVDVAKNGVADITVKKGRFGSLAKARKVKLPYTIDTPYGDFTVTPTQYFPLGEEVNTKILFMGYHAAAEGLAKDITADIASRRSNVIELGINSLNAAMGEAILTDLIDKYNRRGVEERNLQGSQTAKFIDERVKILGNSLFEDETKIQQFKEKNGLVDVKQEVAYQSEKRGEVEKNLMHNETQLEILRMTKDFLTDPVNKFELIPITGDNDAINASITAYNNQIIERKNLLKTVSENHKIVQQQNVRLEGLRNSIITSIDHNLATRQVAVNDLRQQMNNTGSRLGNVPEQEREIISMERERYTKQQLYLYLLRRQEENSMMLATATPKGVIVDAPYTLVKPLGMSNMVIMLVFFFLGLFAPPVYLYLLKLVRNRVTTRREIEDRTDAPILGEMCIDHSGRSLVVTQTDTSSATELFRLMRANLLFIFNDPNDKVVLLTSSASGEGKTFISINLAASLALLGKKVLLVGMDIRQPKLSQYLGVRPAPGLTSYLSSASIALNDIIERHPLPDAPNLDIIVAGPVPPNPAELLVSKKVDALFVQLRDMYDYIVVDSAPVGLVSDTFTLDRIADATVYVTRINQTSNSNVDEIQEIYTSGRLKKLSLVINGVKSKKSYGYGKK